MIKKPHILYFDIETTPNLVFVWRLGKQYVSYDSIHKERKISCICYKWGGEKTIHTLKMNMSLHDLTKHDDQADKKMLEEFCKVYKEADLAVGHNGIKFDIGSIRSRLVAYNLPDIAPVILDDTYISTKAIGFNSHKLDYLSKYLGLGQKAPHPYQLWVNVMQGNEKALDETVEYCVQDVRLLEKIYNAVLPYINTKLNRAAFNEDARLCPSCGKNTLISNGTKVTVTWGQKTQFKCTSCGKYSTSGATKIATDSKILPR
jgi:uncharacterized protein YprB with RNaseH-like and TPR domain